MYFLIHLSVQYEYEYTIRLKYVQFNNQKDKLRKSGK